MRPPTMNALANWIGQTLISDRMRPDSVPHALQGSGKVMGPHLAGQTVSHGVGKPGLEQIDQKPKKGFEQNAPIMAPHNAMRKREGSVDSDGSHDIKRRLQHWIRLNLFWLYNQAYDWNHNCKSQDFNDAVDENAQQHHDRLLSFARIEQPVGPLKDRENGIGVRHGGGQAGDAGKVSVTVRLGAAL